MLKNDSSYVPDPYQYSLYAGFSLAFYAILFFFSLTLIVVTLVLKCKLPRYKMWARLASLILLLLFSGLLGTDSLYHVTETYEDSPNALKHILYWLPICFLITSYLLNVGTWHQIMARFFGRRDSRWIVVLQAILNVIVYALFIVFAILTRSETESIRFIGFNNLVFCGELCVALVYCLIVGLIFIIILLRQQHTFRGVNNQYKGALIRVTILTLASTVAFIGFTVMMIDEGIYFIQHNGFIVAYKGYTTKVDALWAHMVVTILPPIALLACYVQWDSICPCCKKKTTRVMPLMTVDKAQAQNGIVPSDNEA